MVSQYGISKRAEAVKGCRKLSKADMVLNDYLPKITGKPSDNACWLVCKNVTVFVE